MRDANPEKSESFMTNSAIVPSAEVGLVAVAVVAGASSTKIFEVSTAGGIAVPASQ
jgi:hypothetical protein